MIKIAVINGIHNSTCILHLIVWYISFWENPSLYIESYFFCSLSKEV